MIRRDILSELIVVVSSMKAREIMSLYGHTNINLEALKRWANSLSVDEKVQVEIGGEVIVLNDQTREILRYQTQEFAKLVNHLKEGDDWRNCQKITNHMFYNAFVRTSNSAIKIADFYECLIVPSNMKTYKKVIQGFDYINIGTINIKDNQGNVIAIMGTKSDLIWTTFYEYFVNENDDGSINHVYSNHEQYLSLQLFNVEYVMQNELSAIVNEILLRVSMEYDMDFKIFEVDPMFKEEGKSPVYNMQFTLTGFEQIPMLYLTNAINTTDERLSYLSYYQVIEYFFVRSQNYYFLNEFAKIDVQNVNHNELRKVLRNYKKICTEREALKLVFQQAVNIPKLKTWLCSNIAYQNQYCNSSELKIDITKEDKKIISALAERVYNYRCSIAHAKGDVEEYIAVPSLCKETIAYELPLLKYLAFEVISNCSEPQ